MMISCPHCSSITFDDMPICYGCLQPLNGDHDPISIGFDLELDNGDDLYIEEPEDTASFWIPDSVRLEDNDSIDAVAFRYKPFSPEETGQLSAISGLAKPGVARFHIVFEEVFAYDAYLEKSEGQELTVGCARDNNIVLPHTESKRHQIRVMFSQGRLWVEDRGSVEKARIDGTPLTGTRCLEAGTKIEIGAVRIECLG